MAAWCLPRNLSKAFMDAIHAGELTSRRLMDMTSDERRATFAKLVGEENAREINAQFESTMLLSDQKRGMVTWAKNVAGVSDSVRRDLLSTISKLDRVLNPAEEQLFLEDLAAKKLGVTVTADEAKAIYQLGQRATAAKAEMLKDIENVDNRIAYGRAVMDLKDQIESLKPRGQTFTNRMIDVLNIPKTALTSILHFSAPFVQGWGMISTKRAWEAFGKMFQYFADEENYKNLDAYIISHPDYHLAVDAKLGITKLGDRLSTREEAIQSTLVEQANQWLSDRTGVPNLVRASSRAFTGYLNYVRFNRFTDLLSAARLTGADVSAGSQVVADLGRVVNNFTGRGNEISLGVTTAEIPRGAVPALNAIFFSPRKIAATVEMFNPLAYAKLTPVARNAAIRQLTGSLVATGAVLSIAKAMGASVDPDPRSTNFGKIVIGGEKLDMTGGNATYLRLLARIITNQQINAQGKLTDLGQNAFSATRASLLANYARGKLSPIAGFIADALYGKDPVGRPFSLSDELRDKLMPITMDSFLNFAMNDPGNTAAIIPALSALFGVGLESPLPPVSHNGMSVWGDPIPHGGEWRNDPVNKEAEEIGLSLNFPMQTIRGVKLDDSQYDDYVRLSGRMAHMRLESVVQMPGWSSMPTAARLSTMRSIIRKSRDIVATSIMLQSQGTPHDIVKQATDAKMAKLGAPQLR